MSRKTGREKGERHVALLLNRETRGKSREDRKTEKGDENVVLTELSADGSSDKRKE